MENGTSQPRAVAIDASDKLAVLAGVLASAEFAGSPKLGEFLSYIVQQHVAGEDARIKGKTIAVDVYGRDAGEGDDSHNIVRVEARRLRRLLEEYYAGSGAGDSLRLWIDPGGYVPRFEHQALPTEPAEADVQPELTMPKPRRADWAAPLLGGIALVALLLIATLQITSRQTKLTQLSDPDTRAALRDYSVNALQAKDIAAEARDLYFPVFDARRQQIALDMFEYAVELAPELSDGHSGAAQSLATLHMITSDPILAGEYLERAQDHARRAVHIAPTDPWAIAARAWVSAQAGDIEAARSKAQMAFDLAPEDGHVLDLVGVTAIHANAAELAAQVSNPKERGDNASSGTRNIWGLANLMLRDDRQAIDAFGNATKNDTVISAPSLIFLAIAHDRSGNKRQARRLVAELKRDWPEFPSEFVVRSVFSKNLVMAEEIMARLRYLQPPA